MSSTGDGDRSFQDIFRGTDAENPNGPFIQLIAFVLTIVFLFFLLYMSCVLCRCGCRVAYTLAYPVRWCARRVGRARRMRRVRSRVAQRKPRLAQHPDDLCRCPIDASGAGIDDGDGDDAPETATRYCVDERLLCTKQPYCVAHRKQRRERRTALADRFRNARYTFSELYYSKQKRQFQRERSCDALADSIARRLRAPDAPPPTEGFVYMYASEYDLDLQEAHTGSRDVDCDEVFFYKIGFTTRSPAKRIAEHDSAVFVSGTKDGVEFVDYVRVLDVRSAESIVHALLCDERYQRFDAADCAFEVEWFLVEHEKAASTLRRAAKMVSQEIDKNE